MGNRDRKEATMRKIDVQIDELEIVIDVAMVEWDEPPGNVLVKSRRSARRTRAGIRDL